MILRGTSFCIPGGTGLVGAVDASRLLLKTGEVLAVFDVAAGAIETQRMSH